MTQANAIIGLQAQTSIHAGTGQNTGIIDLPIQRESHTGWPCIFGSSAKGALRTHAEQKLGIKNPSISLVFGPDTNNASEHGGALAVSDARLLLFPTRSLTSHFKWVTCPAIIERFSIDCMRFQQPIKKISCYTVDDSSALIPQAETSHSTTDNLFLEEYHFKTEKQPMDALIAELSQLMSQTESILRQQLVIVSNNMFAHLVQHGTPVTPHITINSETKIVEPGALWYQETLPPETLLYIGLSASQARKKEVQMPASQILNAVLDLFVEKPWLQIGGSETVGMGWCAVSLLNKGN